MLSSIFGSKGAFRSLTPGLRKAQNKTVAQVTDLVAQLAEKRRTQ